MTPILRAARRSDTAALVELRALMFADMGVGAGGGAAGGGAAGGGAAGGAVEGPEWRVAAAQWFARAVDDPLVHVVVIQDQQAVVSCGMVEIRHGAPGPGCPTGRTAHVSNVVTRREARGRGLAGSCLTHLLEWAAGRADRAELFASDSGVDIYRRLGFVDAGNPAMRLALTAP